MAHMKYDDNDKAANRIELCPSCHFTYDKDRAKQERRRSCAKCGSTTTYLSPSNGSGHRRDNWYAVNHDRKHPWHCYQCHFTLLGMIRS